VLLIMLLTLLAPNQGASVLVGTQEGRFFIVPENPDLFIPNYHNKGYSQVVTGSASAAYFVKVKVDNALLYSRMRGRTVSGLPESLKPLENRLNAISQDFLADQVSLLISWLRHEFHQQEDFVADQSLDRIIATRSANCVGLSALAIYVLGRMQVKARYVTGVAFKPSDKARLLLEGNVLHRWIEVYYEDVGWVFSDPAGKVNFVDATYVVLGVEGLHPLEKLFDSATGTQVELTGFENGFRPVGTLSNLDGRIFIRPNRLFTKP